MRASPVMKRAIRLGRQYWLLSVTILVSILGLILQLVGWKYAAHWLLGLMDLLAAIVWLGHAWKELQSGSYRVNYVAIIAVVTAVVVHAYWVGIALVAAQSLLVILLARLTRRAHHELDLLDEVEPQMAQVLQGRKLSEVKASSVVAGSKFTVGPQDTVPADGVILEGSATVDETFLTGEPRPTAVGVDAHVLAGSRVTEGNLTVRATRDYKNSQ
ncbi:MAG TPA: hypothetical protein VFH39_01875, partial [Candidatus Saccharimonadales bacterium]|nr:hypothetical protein [Candidatus Saccharimonadales bacterium]